MTRIALVLACSALTASMAHAEVREGTIPEAGVDRIAAVGTNVLEKFHYAVVPAFQVSEAVQATVLLANVDIPAGAKLLSTNSRKVLKACYFPDPARAWHTMMNGCLIDDNRDGYFDRVAGTNIQGGKKLDHPVSYKESEISVPQADGNYKQYVIYLGTMNATLRLSYREFINDMARPAFTEDYTFPLTDKYPQAVAFKDVKLVVTNIDGEGLHYRLEK
ncbi:hypothetical protein [uncultured Sphingomonas sp.]|uniref:hypothetical protein n=1 Tax=uncultured Sphingomonas sp. TaxID=158754 RepID=UPI0025D170F7|nr:hypothetical protein [uncultured Sphingomonas sp.]